MSTISGATLDVWTRSDGVWSTKEAMVRWSDAEMAGFLVNPGNGLTYEPGTWLACTCCDRRVGELPAVHNDPVGRSWPHCRECLEAGCGVPFDCKVV